MTPTPLTNLVATKITEDELRVYLQLAYDQAAVQHSLRLQELNDTASSPEYSGSNASVLAEYGWVAQDCKDYLKALDKGGMLAVVQLCGFKFILANLESERFAGRVHAEIFGQVST